MAEKGQIRIALAGNPNCGKTTMFNNITGAKQHVGNYAGVTVEKKEAMLILMVVIYYLLTYQVRIA